MSLMNSLSKLAKSVSDNASNVAKKSSEMFEITKVNLAIQAEEDRMKIIQNEIGAIIFGKFSNGQEVDPDIIQNCNSIIQVQNQIAELQIKITKLKNLHICEKCGEEVVLDSVFCPKCGGKQDITEYVATDVEEKEIIKSI